MNPRLTQSEVRALLDTITWRTLNDPTFRSNDGYAGEQAWKAFGKLKWLYLAGMVPEKAAEYEAELAGRHP